MRRRIHVLIISSLLIFSSALAGCLEEEYRSDMDEIFEEDSDNRENNTTKTAPIITLLGDEEVRIMVSNSSSEGVVYTDSGAICTDEEDGDLSANVTVYGMVPDVLIPGEYVFTYFCEDSDGNSVEVRRVVIILEWDSDGDGVPDKDDAFPDDANETSDRDGDGVGDNADAFPDDGRESADSDGDGVGDIGDQCPETPSGATVDANGCELTAEEHFTNISGMAFSPNTITISVGDNITWTNQDNSSHTATGDNSEFNSGTLGNGQTFSFTFTTEGTYTYHCAFHSGMTATIIVE